MSEPMEHPLEPQLAAASREPEELPDLPREGRPSAEAAARATVQKPKIGDTRPAPATAQEAEAVPGDRPRRRRRRGRGGGGSGRGGAAVATTAAVDEELEDEDD